MATLDISLLVFLALVFLASAALFARFRERRELEARGKVVALGDSLTYGQGIPVEDNFVSILSRRLGVFIINAGVPGDTTEDALARLDRDVIEERPDAVIVFLGGNDFLRPLLKRQGSRSLRSQIFYAGEDMSEIPLSKTFENLREIIRRIHAIGAKVILVGFSTEFLDNFEEKFAELAEEENVEAYVPNVLSGILFNKDYLVSESAPRVHPNAYGHRLIADRIEPALAKVLKSK